MKLSVFSFLIAVLLSHQVLIAQKSIWPKEIPLAKTGGKITIYQPQPDELTGNILKGMAAISGREKLQDDLSFGAIFFEAKLSTDKSSRMASLESLKITKVKVNGLTDQDKTNKLISLIESEATKWNLEISLDQLVSTIKEDTHKVEMYNNNPPKIIYAQKPTTLVILDGEPKINNDKNLDADRVINSPYLIFKESGQWNLYVGGTWYNSNTVLSGWTPSKKMSTKVKSINDQIKKQEKDNNDNKDVTATPEVTDIVVSTEPAEIIQSKGAAVYTKLDSTTLQYISNSANDILKTSDGQIYILITGRWFSSTSLNGPWTYNEPDKMPADFAKIPRGSAKDGVLSSISGTPEAEEAIIEAEIPQTAKVKRSDATVKVEYDGDPQFESIEGCMLRLAINANLTVLQDGETNFFALDNGIWFLSSSAKGPWKVADTRPRDIEKISVKSAAYNSKFVYIYESDADYVTVGYTGGYLGNYVQGDPVVIYGTGYYYTPWYGAVYYPRPCTWGYGFSYNPWTGWSMSYSYNIGFLQIGFNYGGGYGYSYGGWFGPPMYYPPCRPPYYYGGYYGGYNRAGGNRYSNTNVNVNANININNSHNNNIYLPNNSGSNNRPGVVNRPQNNDKPNRPDGGGGNNNNRPDIGNKPGSNGGGINGGGINKPSTPNNVFADKDGNVFQKDNTGAIKQRDNSTNSWSAPKNPASTRDINQDAQSRDRGDSRMNNFNRPSAAPARGQSMQNFGGGGGGRRH
ncbi:MAG: hypothetical protein WCH52_11300 [Bacteroidota bacterium]